MYFILKFVHVAAVIVFVGNITVGVFWKAFADQTRDPRIIAHTMEGIIRADRIFTIPGIIVLLLAGFATAGVGHIPILGTGWILWAIVLFIIAGIAFGPLSRMQRALAALARAAVVSGSMDWVRYAGHSKKWNLFGLIALITPLLAVALMVVKPLLPAFHR